MKIKKMEDVKTAFDKISLSHNYSFTLKEKQLACLNNLIERNNVIAILPTGYGKSVIFSVLPCLLNEMRRQDDNIVVVITPLKALMADQMEALKDSKIPCAVVTEETSAASLTAFSCSTPLQVLYLSPEAANTEQWQRAFNCTERRVCAIVIDEAHCVTEWGNDSFRVEYSRLISLRACFPNTPWFICSATLTDHMIKQTLQTLRMKIDDFKVVAASLDRPNIYLNFQSRSRMKFEIELQWLVDHFREKGRHGMKTVIYCRHIRETGEVYGWLLDAIGPAAFVGRRDPSFKIVEQYHSESTTDAMERIMKVFKKEDSIIRCLIATVAFGMGVNVPDISCIVHWGASASISSYWQEVGRCSRNNSLGSAHCYATKTSISRYCDPGMQKFCGHLSQSSDACVRNSVLEHLTFGEFVPPKHKVCTEKCEYESCMCTRCTCCNFCRNRCECFNRKDNV